MRRLLRYGAAVITGLSLSTGVVAAQSATTEGPNSPATVHVRNHDRMEVRTDNRVNFRNQNSQASSTGTARAHNNTTVGDVGSGSASADNSLSGSVWVDNTGVSSGMSMGADSSSVSTDASSMGPNSPARVRVDNNNSVEVKTNNNVSVSNNNTQHATSGNASASNNTTVGSVTSGDATATNDTTFDLTIMN